MLILNHCFRLTCRRVGSIEGERESCFLSLTLSGPGAFWVLGPGGGGKEGGEVPAAHNSKTIHGIEMKFARVVGNHKLIRLV